MNKIMANGAAGVIGRRAARELLAAGHLTRVPVSRVGAG
jgi:nucleoside-diphosphate-sugar epimerase